MTILADAAYFSPPYPTVDGWLVYLGGDTPNPVSVAQMAALPGGYRLPVWVRSNPAQASPADDGLWFVELLGSNSVPKGVVTILDLETAIDPGYVTEFGSVLHNAGYLVWPYGSKNFVFQNPRLDGYFVADPTGTEHIVTGSVATQYFGNGQYDLDDIANSSRLWNTNAAPSPKPPAPPLPQEDDMKVIEDADKKGIYLASGMGVMDLSPDEVSSANAAFGPTVTGVSDALIASMDAFAQSQMQAAVRAVLGSEISAAVEAAVAAALKANPVQVSLKGDTGSIAFE